MKRSFDKFSEKEDTNQPKYKNGRLFTRKRFQLSEDKLSFNKMHKEVAAFARTALEGDDKRAADWEWKKELGIKIKKQPISYPTLKKMIKERKETEKREKNQFRFEEALRPATKAPVLPHMKADERRGKPTRARGLRDTVGTFSKGTLSLGKADVARVFEKRTTSKKEGKRKGMIKGLEGPKGPSEKKGKKRGGKRSRKHFKPM